VLLGFQYLDKLSDLASEPRRRFCKCTNHAPTPCTLQFTVTRMARDATQTPRTADALQSASNKRAYDAAMDLVSTALEDPEAP
jgi:hypothetical protein